MTDVKMQTLYYYNCLVCLCEAFYLVYLDVIQFQ